MSAITVTLPDGSQRELTDGATGADLAADIGSGLAKAVLIAEVNGQPSDLSAPLPDGAEVRFLTKRDPEVLEHLRHSTAHVLAQAVLDLWPGATFAGGPPIEDGFYYDFELPDGGTFSEGDLARIEERMRRIIKSNQPFERYELELDDAMAEMGDHPYKQAFMSAASGGDDSDGEAPAGETISFYRNGDGFVDMCRGPHVPSTGKLGWFKLMRVAGAYFRGSEANPMLQRIYGTAWTSKDDLTAHLERLEQAAARDHRKLGVELDLFSFPEEIGSGLAVFHPKGGIVRMLMEDYSRKRHAEAGYEFVNSPHITKEKLFQISGHLDWFADGMFPPMQLDLDGDGEATNYYLKPMNCPFHILIFQARMRSYRELPLRMFEFGTVYRYEKSGVLHGLTRVRGLTMDDAHIFTTKENMGEELSSLLDFVLSLLRDYGLDDFYLELSTKPEEKAVGTDEEWDEATEALRQVAVAQGLDLVMDPGGGAFYGPKISVQARDAIGRTWQMSTIQVDFQLPQRFELEYVGSDGERHRPIMIHRALFGSVERFFGVLVEHYAGAFPTWLAPVQVAILPVADAHDDYAHDLAARLRTAGYRPEVIEANDTLGKRIRNAKGQKLPYVLVVGDDDVAHDTVGVNPRGGSVERDVSVDAFLERLAAEVESKGIGAGPGTPVGVDAGSLDPDGVPQAVIEAASRPRSVVTLDHLWSTWRSNYVSTLGDPPGDAEGTLFERILGAPEGDREKFVVARGRRCFALLNLFPYTAGHVMVLPNRGLAGLDDLNDEEFAELWAMVRDATVACREGLGCDAVNVGVNLGPAAGGSQSDHLHVHVVPRWAGDANFMTATADTRTLPVSLPEAWDRLRAGWPGGAPPAWMKGQAND